ncbi:MAG: pilus assembly protein PilM [Planctomycetales bacterium]|nr:pilus assembly protein PilM [Planctomycetales bacterium]
MASGNGVWGIDIGQSGLKALRATLAADGESIVAEAFDFIEYPKILSQPDAKPDELVRDALKNFLSRNDLRGDKVAISLSGQSGLARFVQLPPVESKKIPNIVAYEAKQQIPFDLNDVIWDYQQMPGATETEGVALETEVGIFAMKRDQVFRAIRPLIDAEVELDIIQLTPLCIYNAICYDVLKTDQRSDDGKTPEPIAILSMGTDTSDLVVTDGYSVWQRNIPLGGNHFTNQLTKELKFTFAKSEHVKRNARDSDDAKEIFQAMRPVFSNLVTEVHRSLGFYQSRERDRGNREPKYIVVLGNAAKLPGLPQYLEKNLETKVVKLRKFNRVSGAGVVDADAFKSNILAFPVCYGLVLQGLGKSNLRTNLLPREILRSRLIRRKKPWAAAIAATLLLGCSFNYFLNWNGWNAVHADTSVGGVTWRTAQGQVDSLKSKSSAYIANDEEKLAMLQRLYSLGDATVGSTDARLLWLELYKTITEALPKDPNVTLGQLTSLEDRQLKDRREIYIDAIRSVYYPSGDKWVATAQAKYEEDRQARIAEESAPAAGAEEDGAGDVDSLDDASSDEVPSDVAAPEGGGGQADFSAGFWVIEIDARHFYTADLNNTDRQYVRNTLLKFLDEGEVSLPAGPGQPEMTFTTRELGIFYPHIHDYTRDTQYQIPNPNAEPEPATAQPAAGVPPKSPLLGPSRPQPGNPKADTITMVDAPCSKFTVRFAWTQIPLRQRLEKRQQAQHSTDNVAAADPGAF